MKKILLLTLFVFYLSSITYCQVSNPIIIRKHFSNSVSDIDTLINIRNKKIVFETLDTLFIINKYGVSAFIKCANDQISLKDNFTESLQNLNSNISSLSLNFNQINSETESMVSFIKNYESETRKRIELIDVQNDKLKNSVELLNKQLEDAYQKIKQERWNSLGTNLFWGIGGTALGILVAAILIK